MENNTVSLNVDEQAIKPIVQKAIQSAIAVNLGKQEDLIEYMVALDLRQKVDRNGSIGKYSSDNKYDFLEAVTNRAIREAAKEAIAEWLSTRQEQVKQAMLKELNKPSRQKSIVKAFADAAERSFKCDWNFHCKIDFKKD